MQFIAPPSLFSPPPEQDIHAVRGDVLNIDMGFQGVPEIAANLSAYRLRVGFRRRQTDTLPFIVVRNAVLELMPPGETFGGEDIEIAATVAFTPEETNSFPATGCVYLVEWTNAVGGANRRILQGRVTVSD